MIKIENVGKPYMRYLAKVIPLAFDESMSYYEQVCSFKHYLLNEVMPTINNNAEAVVELQNYFSTLNVQDEIDNKLDEMYENGQLENIISEYIQLSTTYAYDTINDMKSSTNLINGSFAKTNGYHSLSDGGSAYYKIRTVTNLDTIDDMFIIRLNDENLVAELIYSNELNIKQIGAYGDNDHDDTIYFQTAIDKMGINGGNIIIPDTEYKLLGSITVTPNNKLVNLIGEGKPVIDTYLETGYVFDCTTTSPNYIKITFNNFTIRNLSNSQTVSCFNIMRCTELKVFDNVMIRNYYNNINIQNCWSLIFNKLSSVGSINSGFESTDVCNSFNFISCIFTNNNNYNINLVGRAHSFTQCDLSSYLTTGYSYFHNCSGLSFNGCYYEEQNINKGFTISNSRGVSFNGCYFECRSNVENYKLFDLSYGYGVTFNGCEFRSFSTISESSYLLYIANGSAITVNTCDFRDCKKVIYLNNSNLSLNKNKLDSVTCFITQYNHVYARITGNLLRSDEYTNCVIPHPEVVNLTIDNIIRQGNTTNRPDGVYVGQQYFNTQTNHLDIYNGSSWITS